MDGPRLQITPRIERVSKPILGPFKTARPHSSSAIEVVMPHCARFPWTSGTRGDPDAILESVLNRYRGVWVTPGFGTRGRFRIDDRFGGHDHVLE